MKVRVCGPNLRDQSKGQFHVHADGCADLSKYGPGRKNGGDRNGEDEMVLDANSKLRVAEWVYDDCACDENEWNSEGYWEYLKYAVQDFHFAPCVKLPFKAVEDLTPADFCTCQRMNVDVKDCPLHGHMFAEEAP